MAAYFRELDCVAILSYSPDFLDEFDLSDRSHLLGVNYYSTGAKHADLEFGPGRCTTWTGFHPIIAAFVTGDRDRLAEQKASVPEYLWDRTWELGRERIRTHPEVWRSGEPYAIVAVE